MLLNVYLILTARLSDTSSVRCTCKKHSANVLLLVAIEVGQDILTDHKYVYLKMIMISNFLLLVAIAEGQDILTDHKYLKMISNFLLLVAIAEGQDILTDHKYLKMIMIL